MHAGYYPMFLDAEIVLKIQEKIIRRHEPSREKICAHPVILIYSLKDVTELSVAEHVNKEPALGL